MPVGEEYLASFSIPAQLAPADLAVAVTSPSGHTTQVPVTDATDKDLARLQEQMARVPVDELMDKTKAPSNLQQTANHTPVDELMEKKVAPIRLQELGPHSIDVTYGGVPLQDSPYNVEVMPAEEVPKVKVYGPGLTEGEALVPSQFTIDSREEPKEGQLAVKIEGPSKPNIELSDNGDGTCEVMYVPAEPGEYMVNVLYADQHVPGSPFTATVAPNSGAAPEDDLPKVKAYGPGLLETEANVPAQFTIDMREEAQPGALSVSVEGPMQAKIDVKDNGDGTCDVTYVPELPGDYKINVTHADKPIPGSPFHAKVVPGTDALQESDAPRVKAFGSGLTEGEAKLPAQFTIDTREETRPGSLGVAVEGPIKTEIDCRDNGDGTVSVTYMPEAPGDYKISITHADKPIPESPFTAKIEPSANGPDVSAITASGIGLSPEGNDCICMSTLCFGWCASLSMQTRNAAILPG